jgi:hypothetical protein
VMKDDLQISHYLTWQRMSTPHSWLPRQPSTANFQ